MIFFSRKQMNFDPIQQRKNKIVSFAFTGFLFPFLGVQHAMHFFFVYQNVSFAFI